MKAFKVLVPALLGFAAVGAVWLRFGGTHRPKPAVPAFRTSAGPEALPPVLAMANSNYAAEPEVAKRQYEQFIHAAGKLPDAQAKDQVASAQVRLGFLASHDRTWRKARSEFLSAAGTEKSGAVGEFGSMSDVGAYQAAVCLAASGDKPGAVREFRQFLRDRPLSPLARAAFRRLSKLNGGEPGAEDEAVFQRDLAASEHEIRLAEAECGPRAIAFLLSSGALGPPKAPAPDYREISKLCGTTESGTSVAQMRDGLSKLGISAYAYRLNRPDLAAAPAPAILLLRSHFVALLGLEGDRAKIYDPLTAKQTSLALPPLDDPDFFVDAILFSRPKLQ